MRWQDLRPSTNIQDIRGMGGRGIAIGGGGLATVILIVAALICGVDPRQLLENSPPQSRVEQPAGPGAANSAERGTDRNRDFAAAVLGSTENVWNDVLPEQAGRRYVEPKLVLFSGQVSSACGYTSSAVGPFYCPGDQKLYLDFSFFEELRQQFRAPGDFAQAYVIAHEVGHHVQNLLGTMDRVQRAGNSNRASVALELQADCYAGVWAHYAEREGLLEAGDVQEALRAASAVGDDNIQRRTQGYVVPDSFTHGSAEQRMEWFSRGMESGSLRQCETFR